MLDSWSPSRFNQAPGFTLVEILVVLIIVSVMSGIVVTSLPSSFQNSDFDEESLRLKTVIELIREESLTRASEYGLKTDKDNYSFFVYNEIEQNWTQLNTKPYAEHKLGYGILLKTTIEDNELILTDEEDEESSVPNAPRILLLSSGEMTPFEITIALGRDKTRTLVSDGYSELAWQDELDEKKGRKSAPRR
ncbi:type II secretion system minor pseudopilin GspH [Pseudomonadales bacterium]|jgi:general secretion pathway protein H|nr:type II secretion system minor pseudopilin GspH [Gammaproteobacteria bacterium]MDA7726211.1 type II secretion system minor pseudopilin GspH [Pseudomonadales bacterium]|tara:strand:+ start:4294 stop:4869 length:576 start_codon:yes stop_codon:yes gene_type:complete